MNWKFDPAITSAGYLALARKRARYHDVPREWKFILDWDQFDFGVHRAHVDRLLDQHNWSEAVVAASRKPRIFIEAYWNRRGNIEIRSIGGNAYKIYFEEDFTRRYVIEATMGHYGPHRSDGEVMWMDGFERLYSRAKNGRSPFAKALLFGFKARLDELIRELSAQLDVVGAMPMEIEYVGKNASKVEFVPNIAKDQIRAMQIKLFGFPTFGGPDIE